MERLNSIVWPAVAEEVHSLIKTTDKPVVVIEAALLLKANWQKNLHEVKHETVSYTFRNI